eukprot:6778382-Pyramimonas_sp.AAC.1
MLVRMLALSWLRFMAMTPQEELVRSAKGLWGVERILAVIGTGGLRAPPGGGRGGGGAGAHAGADAGGPRGPAEGDGGAEPAAATCRPARARPPVQGAGTVIRTPLVIILLRLTGPPVPITARMHPTPQTNSPCDNITSF